MKNWFSKDADFEDRLRHQHLHLCLRHSRCNAEKAYIYAIDGDFGLCTSAAIIMELALKLDDKFGWQKQKIAQLIIEKLRNYRNHQIINSALDTSPTAL